jgi:hypothetical protein
LIARVLLVALVLVIAVCSYPGALIQSMVVRLSPLRAATSQAASGTTPWLHVEHPVQGTPYIADDQGRLVLLHGAIPASLLEFGSTATTPPGSPIYSIDPAAYDGKCPDAVAAWQSGG